MKRYFGALVLALAVTAITVPTIATAAVKTHTFGDNGTRFDSGRFAQVTVQAACDAGDILLLEVTLTQADAFARTTGSLLCTGNTESLPATMRSGGGLFDAGAATVCGIAATVNLVGVKDTKQTCESVTLA
ncbi:MAG: hypothetical protein ACT4OM_00010 [Actinomycetota bacterium]